VQFLNNTRSRAILIGTSKYNDESLRDLPEVIQSVHDLAALLTDPGQGVVPSPLCEVMLDEADIRLIGRKLRTARQAEDLLLVYYVGHGLIGSRRHDLYLALPDSEWAEPEFNSLEFEKLRSAVLDSPAATKVIILDCCFSGRAATEPLASGPSEILGQIEVAGTYVLTSAQRNQVALIVPGEAHTAFSGRLIQLLETGISGGPEFLTIDDLFQELCVMMKAAGLSQPQRRATYTAGLLPIAKNNAFSVNVECDDEAGGELSGDAGHDARHGLRKGARASRKWLVWGILAAVLSGIIAGILSTSVSPSSSPPIGKTYEVVAPEQVGGWVLQPAIGREMGVRQLSVAILNADKGQMSEVVSGVYESRNAPTINKPLFLFVGGRTISPTASFDDYTKAMGRVRRVPAGPLGGIAACILRPAHSDHPNECVWFGGDSFGALASPTMTLTTLAKLLVALRPQFELPVITP
jgi:Caspase domain